MHGRRYGVVVGSIMGLLIDAFIGRIIGIYSLMLGLCGYIGGKLEKRFSKDSKITMIIIVMSCTVILEFLAYIINIAINSIEPEILSFFKINIIEVLYNAILTIILYPAIKKGGYFIQNIYKGNKVLTRYF